MFSERGVVWEETIILLPDNVHYVFLSATIPNAKQFAEWICHLHKQVSWKEPLKGDSFCLLKIAHSPINKLRHSLNCCCPISCFVALPCGVHRLPSHSPAALPIPSRGRRTPSGGRRERKLPLKPGLPFKLGEANICNQGKNPLKPSV